MVFFLFEEQKMFLCEKQGTELVLSFKSGMRNKTNSKFKGTFQALNIT